MVTGGKQKVTVVEAIKVWTLDGAYATFEEKIKGSITPGKLADFVVLQRDPHKVAPDTIKEFAVEATYLVGPEDLFCAAHAMVIYPQPPVYFGDGDEESNEQ